MNHYLKERIIWINFLPPCAGWRAATIQVSPSIAVYWKGLAVLFTDILLFHRISIQISTWLGGQYVILYKGLESTIFFFKRSSWCPLLIRNTVAAFARKKQNDARRGTWETAFLYLIQDKMPHSENPSFSAYFALSEAETLHAYFFHINKQPHAA